MALIDKQLTASNWYEITTSWDFQIVTDEVSILQAAQNRILAEVWSWIFDDDYWSLLAELKNTPVQAITSEQVAWYIQTALQPLIDDSRIQWIQSVEIIDRDLDSIQVEIKIDMDLSVGTLNINIVT